MFLVDPHLNSNFTNLYHQNYDVKTKNRVFRMVSCKNGSDGPNVAFSVSGCQHVLGRSPPQLYILPTYTIKTMMLKPKIGFLEWYLVRTAQTVLMLHSV